MPLLEAETYQYPEDLLASAINGDAAVRSDAQWWAAQTRSRQEKQLMRRLMARGIAAETAEEILILSSQKQFYDALPGGRAAAFYGYSGETEP